MVITLFLSFLLLSEKWTEECLPQEYKRKYNTKSEVSSLSKQGKLTNEQEEEKDLIPTNSGIQYINENNAIMTSNYGVEKEEPEQALKKQRADQISANNDIEELCNKSELLNCGIEKIDFLLKLIRGDRLAVISDRKYAHMLVTRLCFNALLSSSASSKKRMNKREADFFTQIM